MSESEEKQIKQIEAGKRTSLLFALICSLFLAYQCYYHDRKDEPVPVVVWFPTLCLIGGALGVTVDATMIGKLFVK